MKRTKNLISTAVAIGVALGTMATFNAAQASQVTGWDMGAVEIGPATNVTQPNFVFDQYNYVPEGSLVDPNTGAVATGGFMPSGYDKYGVGTNYLTNGAMTWKERDTQGPGLSVVNNDDKTGENCITSSGWNPDSTPTATEMSDWWGVDLKQCSDPWQSSKRFKMVSYVVGGPVDLTFNVSETGSEDIYRILQKYGNQTGERVSGYTTQLGFIDANGNFTEAQAGQGLSFGLRDGTKFSNSAPTPSSNANQGELDSLMAHGLFGAPDNHHTSAGYFNPYTRASFGLLAGETFIETTGLSQVHRDLFGEWLPSNQMKGGYFYDMDANTYTDNALMASCNGAFDEEAALAGAPNAGCDGTWVTYRESLDVIDNGDGTWTIPAAVGTDVRQPIEVDAATLAAWAADPLWGPADIDDLGNVNINTYITVGSTNSWPTNDGNGNATFTLRMTPTFDAATAQAEPGTANAQDFIVTVTAPTTVTP